MTAFQDTPSPDFVPEEPVQAEQRPVAATAATLALPGTPGSAHGQVDGYQRAARIEERNVHWLVVFGAYTREFVAFPRPALPVSGWVASQDPGTLVRLMQQAEAGAMPRGLRAAKSAARSLASGTEGWHEHGHGSINYVRVGCPIR
jgi:hypothetical protein